MALDNEMKAMQVLSKLDDETRDRVLAWSARKWGTKPAATDAPRSLAPLPGELPLVRKGG